MENIFFDLKDLKFLGKDAIIGKAVRLRHPKFCEIGNYSIIDDFTYISTKLKIGSFSHIAPKVTIAGGVDFTCNIGNLCGISSGVNIYCDSNDFENEITSIIPQNVRGKSRLGGNVILQDYVGIGSNSTIMPNVKISEGAIVGMHSVVLPNTTLQPWTIYIGSPARPIKQRNKIEIMKQVNLIKTKYDIH